MKRLKYLRLTFQICLLGIVGVSCSKDEPVLRDPEVSTTPDGESFEVNGIRYYTVSKTTCAVGNNAGLSGKVIIPKKVGSFMVTEIGDAAFKNSAISSIDLPESIVRIGVSAFENCSKLKDLDLRSLVRLSEIKDNAFKGNSFNTINLPYLLSTIGAGAFENCSFKTSLDLRNLTYLKEIKENTFKGGTMNTVYLSSAVRSIGESAFENCKITSLDLKDLTELESIEANTFRNGSLQTISLPQSIKTIGESAFENCSFKTLDLRNLTNLKEIKENTFKGGTMTTVYLSSAVRSIGESAFENCKITSLDLKDLTQLESIEAQAFRNNPLKSISLPLSVKTIGESAFQDCEDLYRVNVENGALIETIGAHAFECKGTFKRLEINFQNMTNLCSIENYAFLNRRFDVGYSYDLGLNFSNLKRLRAIGNYAFYGCLAYTLNFNNCPTLQTIGQNAFENSRISRISIEDCKSLEKIGKEAFKGIKGVNGSSANIDLSSLPSLRELGEGTFRDYDIYGEIYLSNSKNLKTIPDYCMYGCECPWRNPTSRIILPSTIENIGNYAFSKISGYVDWAGNSLIIVINSPKPPIVNSTCFQDAKGMEFEVPAASLTLYTSNSFWKQYSIKAIQ